MKWEDHIIEKPAVQIQVQTPGGPWALRGHPWALLATPGNPGWRAPAEEGAAQQFLSAPLVNRISLSALIEGLGPATLATVGEFAFNADTQIGEGKGFLGPLMKIARLGPDLDEVGWTMVEREGTHVLIIGTDTWRLLIAQMCRGSIYRFVDDRPVASVAHALGVPQQEWGALLKLIQQQAQGLRRLRRSLAEVRDTAQELLEISPDEEDPRLTEARKAMAAQAGLAQEAQLRLARVREVCRQWGWDEEQIASLLALPGEPRTHAFPATGPRATHELRALNQRLEQIADERRDLDAARATLADLLAPRTYKAGDSVPQDVLWWAPSHRAGREWRQLRGCHLDPGDLWLPMPPPPPGAIAVVAAETKDLT